MSFSAIVWHRDRFQADQSYVFVDQKLSHVISSGVADVNVHLIMVERWLLQANIMAAHPCRNDVRGFCACNIRDDILFFL